MVVRAHDGPRPGKYESAAAFGKQGLSFSIGNARARSMDAADDAPEPGAYFEADDVYSDITRFSNPTIARTSERWAQQLARTPMSPQRGVDWIEHKY